LVAALVEASQLRLLVEVSPQLVLGLEGPDSL
jgi:hypothetical protein